MHRTISWLRKLSWSVLAGLAIQAPATSARAQEAILQPAAQIDVKTHLVPVNQTKQFGMTRAPGSTEDPIIEKVSNDNPKVIRLNNVPGDARHIFVTGISAGTARITFTGYTDPNKKDRHDEVIEIRVPSDDEPVREQQRRDFLEFLRKTAPTANVDAIVGPNNTVFLTGNVLTADSVQTIMLTANSIFGAGVTIHNGMRVGSVQQVEVDCVICSVNRSKLRNMSFSWSVNRKDWFLSSILGSGNFSNSITTGIAAAAATQASSGGNLIFGAVNDNGAFFGFLQALRTDGFATIQAEPKVVTLSGRPAQFVSGGETPILTTSGQGAPNVTYKTFGTTITVLPIVIGNGKIHMEIAPLVSSLNQANGITIFGGNSNVQVPGFDTQGTIAAIQVEDGQTVAIGGLIQHSRNASNAKVPVLGDIPFLGAAFRTVNYNEKEQELIILVTPRLIDPMACNQLPARLPTRLTRSPDDFELYLEGLLELPRGPRQTCGPNGHYTASHLTGPTAGLFPCGDGNCGAGIGGYGHRISACGPTGCQTGACANDICAPKLTTSSAAPVKTGSTPMALPAAPVLTPVDLPPTSAAPVRTMSTAMPVALPPAPAMTPADLPPAGVAPASFHSTHTEGSTFGPPLRLPGTTAPYVPHGSNP